MMNLSTAAVIAVVLLATAALQAAAIDAPNSLRAKQHAVDPYDAGKGTGGVFVLEDIRIEPVKRAVDPFAAKHGAGSALLLEKIRAVAIRFVEVAVKPVVAGNGPVYGMDESDVTIEHIRAVSIEFIEHAVGFLVAEYGIESTLIIEEIRANAIELIKHAINSLAAQYDIESTSEIADKGNDNDDKSEGKLQLQRNKMKGIAS